MATYLAGLFLISLPCAASGISTDSCAVTDSSRLNKLSVQVFFQSGSAEIDTGFRDNGRNIASFLTSVDSLANTPPRTKIDSAVLLVSSASPEGAIRLNDSLSFRRASALEKYFKGKGLEDVDFLFRSAGEDWETLARLLPESGIKGWEEAVRIINDTPTYIIRNGRIAGGRKKAMMDMKGGRLWWEMYEKLFPLLRQATLTVYYSNLEEETVPALPEGQLCAKAMPGMTNETRLAPLRKVSVPAPEPRPVSAPEPKPILALKSNLLLDAASVINLGLELPLGKRFSIGADVYCPWWRNRAKDVTVQMFGTDLEGRYWFGDRERRRKMTGFFAGVYAGAGYFDFQLGSLTDGKGIQSEFFFTGGLCAGYAHEIVKGLRLEYSLGIGYYHCNFREYISVKDTKFGDIKAIEYPWDAKRSIGFLPTRASVSLVWMISSGKGGGR